MAALFAVWEGSKSGPPRASVLISTGCFGLAVLVMALPCVAVAAMTYHYVERPFIERIRQAPKPEGAARGKG